MSNSMQSWVALILGALGLYVAGVADAFWFHRFGLTFDMAAIIVFGTACGLHWTVAPLLPFGGPATPPPPEHTP